MKRNVSFVVCLPSRVAKSIANIERSVKHQNAAIFLLLVGLWAAHDVINVLRKKNTKRLQRIRNA